MKRLLLTGLIGLMFMGQMHGAASSNAPQLPPVNYTGTVAQLASNQSYVIWHENMPANPLQKDKRFIDSLRPDKSIKRFESYLQFPTDTRDNLLSAARATDAYISYRQSTNMFAYARWSAGIFAAFSFGLWRMHAANVLHVNWKHVLLSASLASAIAGIYCATRPDHAASGDINNIITLRTNGLPGAVYRLACGFYTAAPSLNCVYDGYFNLVELGTPCKPRHRDQITRNYGSHFAGAENLPMRNLKYVSFQEYFNHVHNYLCNDLASDAKLGALLAAEEKYYIPAYIPIATIATLTAGLVSGVGLARDYGLFTRVQG
jgi:hypothetical protein